MSNKSDLEKDFENWKKSTDTVKEHVKAFDLFFKKETADRINTNILDTIYYDFIDLNRLDRKMLSKPLYIHLDMSISGDKTGIAGVWIKGKKPHVDGEPENKDLYY